MRLTWLAILLLVLCASVSGSVQTDNSASGTSTPQSAQAPGDQKDPSLTTRPVRPTTAPVSIAAAGQIHLDVAVTDLAGKAVVGLEPQNFKVLDNGETRKILTFRSFDGVQVKPAPPVEVFVMVDTVNLPFSQVSYARQEIEQFFRENGGHLAQPVSLILLTDAGMRMQPRPSVDGNALVTVLAGIKGGVHSIYSAMGAEGELQRFQLSLRQMSLIADNESRRPGRKLLIWVGPGWPLLNSSQFSFSDKDQRHYFDNIVRLSTTLREARMAVYSVSQVDTAGEQGQPMLYRGFLKGVSSAKKADTGDLALKVLAVQSGGRVLGPDNHLAEQIDDCIADANAFYTISFNPPAAQHADEYHDLKVVVDQPGATARTNSGYYNQPGLTAHTNAGYYNQP